MTRPEHITATINELERRRDEAAAEVEKYDRALHTMLDLWPDKGARRSQIPRKTRAKKPAEKAPAKKKPARDEGNGATQSPRKTGGGSKMRAAQAKRMEILRLLGDGPLHRDVIAHRVYGEVANAASACSRQIRGLVSLAYVEDNDGWIKRTEHGEGALADYESENGRES